MKLEGALRAKCHMEPWKQCQAQSKHPLRGCCSYGLCCYCLSHSLVQQQIWAGHPCILDLSPIRDSFLTLSHTMDFHCFCWSMFHHNYLSCLFLLSFVLENQFLLKGNFVGYFLSSPRAKKYCHEKGALWCGAGWFMQASPLPAQGKDPSAQQPADFGFPSHLISTENHPISKHMYVGC